MVPRSRAATAPLEEDAPPLPVVTAPKENQSPAESERPDPAQPAAPGILELPGRDSPEPMDWTNESPSDQAPTDGNLDPKITVLKSKHSVDQLATYDLWHRLDADVALCRTGG